MPIALTSTGYNKDVGNPTGGACGSSSGLTVANPKLFESGYGRRR